MPELQGQFRLAEAFRHLLSFIFIMYMAPDFMGRDILVSRRLVGIYQFLYIAAMFSVLSIRARIMSLNSFLISTGPTWPTPS